MSQLCAHELNLIIAEHLPHVLKDTPELSEQLHAFTLPSHVTPDSVAFVTADVVGLYPSIPIDEAISVISTFLGRFRPEGFVHLMQRWMMFVFRNGLVSYQGRVYLQQWGFPMGTPLSPAAANIFMACKEDLHGEWGCEPLRECLVSPKAVILVFKRYIDDYTILLGNATDADVSALEAALSHRIQPFLKIELQSSRDDMKTLDMYVRKRPDFAESGKLLVQNYAKPGHRYQYMPWLSRMPAGVFKGMVISGITRLART